MCSVQGGRGVVALLGGGVGVGVGRHGELRAGKRGQLCHMLQAARVRQHSVQPNTPLKGRQAAEGRLPLQQACNSQAQA